MHNMMVDILLAILALARPKMAAERRAEREAGFPWAWRPSVRVRHADILTGLNNPPEAWAAQVKGPQALSTRVALRVPLYRAMENHLKELEWDGEDEQDAVIFFHHIWSLILSKCLGFTYLHCGPGGTEIGCLWGRDRGSLQCFYGNLKIW